MSIYCGREFSAEDIQAIRHLLEHHAPPNISSFLPWAMDAAQLAAMRAVHTGRDEHHGIDSS